MLIVTPDNFEIYSDFFPNLTCNRWDFPSGYNSRSAFHSAVIDQNYILFAGNSGMGDFVGEFGHSSYGNSDLYEYHAKCLFDSALGNDIPIICINWGMSLLGIKHGLNFRSSEGTENHLVTYKSSMYAVNSYHRYNMLPIRSSRYKYDVVSEPYIESVYIPSQKTFGVRWNPVENCPQSGVDLFDKLLKEYMKVTRG